MTACALQPANEHTSTFGGVEVCEATVAAAAAWFRVLAW